MFSQNSCLIIFFLGVLLYATAGHYKAGAVAFLPILLITFFLKRIRTQHEEHRETLAWLFVALSFGSVSVIYPRVYYVRNESAYEFIRLLYIFSLGLLLLWYRIRQSTKPVIHSKLDSLTLGALLITMGVVFVFVIRASPSPHIDVWSVGSQAVDILLRGDNPYLAKYAQIYVDLNQHEEFFGYPPLCLLFYFPAKILLGDIRFGLIACHVLTGALLHRSAKASGVSSALCVCVPATYLLFPMLTLMVEQAWIDPYSMVLMAAMLRAYQKRSAWVFGLLLTLFLCVKQSNVLCLPVFLVLFSRLKPNYLNLLAMVLIALLINLPFFMWDRDGFLSRVLWFGENAPITTGNPLNFKIRMDSLTIVAWAIRRGISIPGVLPWFFFLVTTVFVMLYSRRLQAEVLPALGYALSFILIGFFALSNLAFCNYYWFASSGIWFSMCHGPLRKEYSALGGWLGSARLPFIAWSAGCLLFVLGFWEW